MSRNKKTIDWNHRNHRYCFQLKRSFILRLQERKFQQNGKSATIDQIWRGTIEENCLISSQKSAKHCFVHSDWELYCTFQLKWWHSSTVSWVLGIKPMAVSQYSSSTINQITKSPNAALFWVHMSSLPLSQSFSLCFLAWSSFFVPLLLNQTIPIQHSIRCLFCCLFCVCRQNNNPLHFKSISILFEYRLQSTNCLYACSFSCVCVHQLIDQCSTARNEKRKTI